MKIRILKGPDVRQALSMQDAISGMKRAFQAWSSGQVEAPLRSRVHVPEQQGVLLTMPAAIPAEDSLVVKLVSVFGRNPERGLPLIHALVLVFDAETGAPQALVDGESLTALRTGAGSGAATDVLARPDSQTVGILGSGAQARSQLEAVCAVRDIRTVRVYSPHRTHAEAFARELAGFGKIPQALEVADSSTEAVRDADIVCAATTSVTPVLRFSDLKSGVHLNGVGSFQASMQEIDAETVKQAYVVADSRESVLAEAGDLVIPLQSGEIGPEHIQAELGEVLNGTRPGRTSAEQVTCFKSCGLAAQDALAAKLILEQAEGLGLGSLLDWT
ncbi:MAG: ornithine cyclodeaminase family protein [bacterium]|jgi:ornithine cyclodeaminase/alanine dehydrogenase-like protein (mu-crystallin family)